VGRITAPRLRSARWPPTGVLLLIPASALAQASPFNTGANSLLQFTLTIATPIAALIVIGLAIAAAVGKIAWSWVIGAAADRCMDPVDVRRLGVLWTRAMPA